MQAIQETWNGGNQMVIWTYSQKWAKEVHGDSIKRLWNKVVTRPTPDILIKVFFYRDKTRFLKLDHGIKEAEKACMSLGKIDDIEIMKVYPATMVRGHYRCSTSYGHGFYENEWNFIYNHPNIKHCITLKIGQLCSDNMIISLQAHEYRHYLQWKKYGASAMGRRINGRLKRPIQVEKDADKWSKQRVEKLG